MVFDWEFLTDRVPDLAIGLVILVILEFVLMAFVGSDADFETFLVDSMALVEFEVVS